MQILLPILEVVLVVVPSLLTVAFVTIAERKTMASMQRRLGPNIVGYYGLLQAFADALKLLLKECVYPTQANIVLFYIGPIITLVFSLLGFAVIPYGSGLSISNLDLGILFMLAVSSLGTYGILLAGWSANSKYAFLGSLRSTAQLISYELILSSAILLVIILSGSLNLNTIVESQKPVIFLLPLFPIFIIFFIGCIAETNRAPFDLAEAESELVSGFMTEHSSVIFVFFFLAEYASIVLICILTSVLFVGGYLNILDLELFRPLFNLLDYIFFVPNIYNISSLDYIYICLEDNYIIEYILSSLNIGIKTSFFVFVFIWVRASFPRIRWDQLMALCWTILLPIIIAYVVLIPCIHIGLNLLPSNIYII